MQNFIRIIYSVLISGTIALIAHSTSSFAQTTIDSSPIDFEKQDAESYGKTNNLDYDEEYPYENVAPMTEQEKQVQDRKNNNIHQWQSCLKVRFLDEYENKRDRYNHTVNVNEFLDQHSRESADERALAAAKILPPAKRCQITLILSDWLAWKQNGGDHPSLDRTDHHGGASWYARPFLQLLDSVEAAFERNPLVELERVSAFKLQMSVPLK